MNPFIKKRLRDPAKTPLGSYFGWRFLLYSKCMGRVTNVHNGTACPAAITAHEFACSFVIMDEG
jgi:hypothetical protein